MSRWERPILGVVGRPRWPPRPPSWNPSAHPTDPIYAPIFSKLCVITWNDGSMRTSYFGRGQTSKMTAICPDAVINPFSKYYHRFQSSTSALSHLSPTVSDHHQISCACSGSCLDWNVLFWPRQPSWNPSAHPTDTIYAPILSKLCVMTWYDGLMGTSYFGRGWTPKMSAIAAILFKTSRMHLYNEYRRAHNIVVSATY